MGELTTIGTKEILIIDDSPVNREILSGLMIRNNFSVLSAESSYSALNILKETTPDLILLDIVLPDIDGYALCKQIKEEEETKGIPVIFISSLDEIESKLTGFAVGGVDYITKPFNHSEVLARVQTQLRLADLQHQLEDQNKQMDLERQRSDALLHNVLPEKVAEELFETGVCQPKKFDDATVCFVDIVAFTDIVSQLSPEQVVEELNDIFTGFDRISNKHNCERIKTIGDAYLFVCGVPGPDPEHAYNVVAAAVEMVAFLTHRNTSHEQQWEVRVGVHSGPVVGGIVGTKKYLYDIFGDTVNVASRMEALAPPMRVNISQVTQILLMRRLATTKRKDTFVKGKGQLSMYLVD